MMPRRRYVERVTRGARRVRATPLLRRAGGALARADYFLASAMRAMFMCDYAADYFHFFHINIISYHFIIYSGMPA